MAVGARRALWGREALSDQFDPISTNGTDYAHHVVAHATEFSDLTTALQKEQIREKREDS